MCHPHRPKCSKTKQRLHGHLLVPRRDETGPSTCSFRSSCDVTTHTSSKLEDTDRKPKRAGRTLYFLAKTPAKISAITLPCKVIIRGKNFLPLGVCSGRVPHTSLSSVCLSVRGQTPPTVLLQFRPNFLCSPGGRPAEEFKYVGLPFEVLI